MKGIYFASANNPRLAAGDEAARNELFAKGELSANLRAKRATRGYRAVLPRGGSLRAFERLGLKSFGNIGETFELTPDKFDSFELQGLPIPQGETKTVEIVSPCWRYKDKLISLPKVRVVD